MSSEKKPKILIIGGGPSLIGSENEADRAILQIILKLRKQSLVPIVLDNNAFSVTLTQLPANQKIIKTVSYQNVKQIIQKIHPKGIVPTLGGYRAIQIAQKLIKAGVLLRYHVQLKGISRRALKMVGNPRAFRQVVKASHEKALTYHISRSIQDAVTTANQLGYPVIIKSLSPRHRLRRKICHDVDNLTINAALYLANSKIHRCIIEPNITGYQEFSMVGIRDINDTKMIISGLEDVDAVGINPGDSMIVAPVQTLTNSEYQTLRNATLQIMTHLQINGFCDVQFAFHRSSREILVTKITPYFTRELNLAIQVTNYPLLLVYAMFLTGYNLSTLQVPTGYDSRIKALEPSLDHILVKMPIWPFEDIHNVDQHLGSLMQSVGAAVGIGGTVEEAILKALRSSQFSPRDVLPSLKGLSEDELIDQLIHPQASRILVLIEALRRHYPVRDLAELTKIQPFYFYKLKRLLSIEKRIIHPSRSDHALVAAHNNGFGDGMLAEIWHQPLKQIQHRAKLAHTAPTYKQIESSAGEFSQRLCTFYSSYELENESQRLSNHSVLVIGRGGNQLGPNTSADYYTAETLIQFHRLGFKTIIINNNPNAVSLIPDLSDKRYLEPIQIGNIMDLIRLEKPQLIVIPGNRHFLVRRLTKWFPQRTIVLPPDQRTGVTLPRQADLGLDYFVYQSKSYLITPVRLRGNHDQLNLVHQLITIQISRPVIKLLKEKANQIIKRSNWQGLVQVLFQKDIKKQFHLVGIRPLRTTETVFLTQMTNINWIKVLIQLYTHQLTSSQTKRIFRRLNVRQARMVDNFPFRQLRVTVQKSLTNNNQAVGASLKLD